VARESDSLDSALELAKGCPVLEIGGAVAGYEAIAMQRTCAAPGRREPEHADSGGPFYLPRGGIPCPDLASGPRRRVLRWKTGTTESCP
jgi:hypothetical protein